MYDPAITVSYTTGDLPSAFPTETANMPLDTFASRRSERVLLACLVLALVLAAVPSSSEASRKGRKTAAPATGTLDDGRLVVSWFGDGLVFKESDEIDYLWVKEGFEIDGHTFHFAAWPEPELLTDRDENDHRLARQMNSDMARLFHDVTARHWDGRAKSSMEDGDVLVEGRIVDCSTGSTAAKVLVGWGAGAGNTTIDLRFKDAASGELLAAMHHRVVSGTTWSTTDSKFVNWAEKLAKEVASKGLGPLYDRGKMVRD